MNVYVRELAAALARAGSRCDVFTRSWSPELPDAVVVEPGFTVHHVPAGPREPLPKERLRGVISEFTDRVLGKMTSVNGPLTEEEGGRYEAVHANYWLSGLSGHVIKHELDIPLICTFHTLDRVKAEAGPEEVEADMPHQRAEAEATIIRCSDAVLASCSVEAAQICELYGAEPDRVRVVAPGVNHAIFGPGHRQQARRAIGLPEDGRLLLFVGRIQPLKGAVMAVEVLAGLSRSSRASWWLVVVGGPSGPRGYDTYEEMLQAADRLGVGERLRVVDPQPHELLSTYYRAADVCIVPSRSESFGLVALEAAACGTPVVASAVGGLTTLVEHGRTGSLVEDPMAHRFTEEVLRIVEDPLLAERMSTNAVLRARTFTWGGAADQLRAIHDELVAGRLVEC